MEHFKFPQRRCVFHEGEAATWNWGFEIRVLGLVKTFLKVLDDDTACSSTIFLSRVFVLSTARIDKGTGKFVIGFGQNGWVSAHWLEPSFVDCNKLAPIPMY